MAVSNVDKHNQGVALRLRALRKQCGMSQQQLASQLGVSFQQVQKYERGLNRMSPGMLQEIAHVMGVPLDWFFASSQEELDSADALLIRRYRNISVPLLREVALKQMSVLAEVTDAHTDQES